MHYFYERFWAKVDKTAKAPCWIWTGWMNSEGYGRMWLNRHHNRRAHKIAYEQEHGAVPEGLVLDHLCRNRRCVNPNHLEPVSPYENVSRSPLYNGNKTHCTNGHLFTEASTYWYPRKYGAKSRVCRTCRRERLQKYRAAKGA